MKIYFSLISLILCINLQSQDKMNDSLPYAQITETDKTFTPGTVISRTIDGLGFRYYWASEGLTVDDLTYTPGNEGRSISETLEHIYGLSTVILNTAKKLPNDRTKQPEKLNALEQRKRTLENLKEASDLFAASTDLKEHEIIFETKKGTATYPFWNAINGPIEDAIWHAGQVVVLRRSAGNPINSKVNVFLGKLND